MENCRVCLEKSQKPIYLSQEYKKKFFQITSVELNETKKEFLCKKCYELLEAALKLRKDAIVADGWFKEHETEVLSDTNVFYDDTEEELKPELKIEVFIEEEPDTIKSSRESISENEKPTEVNKYKYIPKVKDPYICYFCDEKLRRYLDLVAHMKIHKKERRMTCRCCNKLFTDKLKLANHERSYRRRLSRGCSLVCQHCGSVFTEPKGLAMHSRIHTGLKRFKCTIEDCTDAFHDKRSYYKHIVRVHHIARPCVCKDCGAAYSNHISLRTHRRRFHNEETQLFRCEECPDKKYLTKRMLDDHIAFTHRGERNHACIACPRSYGNRKNLKRHIHDNHRDLYLEMIQKGKIRINAKGTNNKNDHLL